ncbi:DUF7683 domain-containing protein [Macellibacteroides fermentans]|uniref:DUF7683 domain-containing protein n=1 Tax=Parabacteroides chartae TaxID=1037355 RepID=A0A1T5F2Z7_9BACT|nr:hypothetical protein [Parabacteroides chartae]SKB90430.1 hypothetical protein SAMN05660349_03274 [Parabacteroides chartae]
MKVTRAIVLYDKKTENYVKNYPINITVDEIKHIFTPYDWGDPLFYGCYEIDKDIVKKLQKYLDFDFDFDLFDYYLEAYQND